MQIDTIRPLSVRVAGAGTAVPSGTLSTVTADDNDATYINMLVANVGPGNGWSLRMGPHTPPVDHERHQIRGRIRAQTNAGTVNERFAFGEGGFDGYFGDGRLPVGPTMQEVDTGWIPYFFINGGSGTVSDLNAGGGNLDSAVGGATALRTAEVYYDIDSRRKPTYGPQVRDAAGFDRSGSTVTDTQNPTLYIGPVDYDGLDANNWTVLVVNSVAAVVFTTSGTGIPPSSIPITTALPDGDYNATFIVRSYIRSEENFVGQQSIPFAIYAIAPPPSPPLLTAVREAEGYRLTWEYPGGQTWDDDYVITEVWRDDCAGSARIAAVPDGLNGSYLDQNVPRLDGFRGPDTDGNCITHTGACDITYRVRYWGYVSTTVTLPTTVPVALVIAWPGTAASIPSGWLRVTELDGYHPRGATAAGVPSITGGVATHSHTTPSHTHEIPAHQHDITQRTSDSSSQSTTTFRTDGLPTPLANQPHTHSLPSVTGMSPASRSGAAAPGTNTVSSDPASREVIWIRSDGSAVQYPVGALAWSTQNVTGWTASTENASRYLKGAVAAGDGGAAIGANTHTHTVNAHTHTGGSHDHPNFTSGVSGPAASTEGGGGGGGTPYWMGRHQHAGNIVADGAGLVPSESGGVTGSSSTEPPRRLLKLLRNTAGGLQTRIIGLYTGAVGSLPAGLTYCNGANGTPDMRGWFARDAGTGSVNSTGGATAHTHTVPAHRHLPPQHRHFVRLGTFEDNDFFTRRTIGSQGSVPVSTHTHDDTVTAFTITPIGSSGAGTSGSASSLPVYREAHFVRLDGTVDGGVLPTPEQRTTEYAEVTVPAVDFGDELDRISSLAGQVIAVPSDRGSSLPRLVADSIPIDGGVHTVSTTAPGEDLSLDLPVEGKAAIDALETLLAEDRVYWAPIGGTPGWFAVGEWSVTAPAPDVKVVSVTLVRQPWPSVPDPVDLL